MIGSAPKFYIGAVLIFWGWNTGMLLFALPAAIIFEASYFIRRRYELSLMEYVRISDSSSVLLVSTLVFAFFSSEPQNIMQNFIHWFPASLFPIVFAQFYGASDKITIGTKFNFKEDGPIHSHKPFNITYPFAAACIFSASYSGGMSSYFYIILTILILWAIVPLRSRRNTLVIWVFLAITAASAGFGVQYLVNKGHHYLQHKALEYFSYYYQQYYADPFKADTALGDIGVLKGSGKVVMMAEKTAGLTAPFLLHEVSYGYFISSTWYNREKEFDSIAPSSDKVWELAPQQQKEFSLNLKKFIRKNKAVLALPAGSHRLERLNVATVKKDDLGTILVDETPDLIDFTVYYSDKSYGGAVMPQDLDLPAKERYVIEKTALELKLDPANKTYAIEKIRKYFGSGFSYSTRLKGSGRFETATENFLIETKTGHCELYATATVFLLRKAGIPARYATGFLVQEYSEFENMYIIRERHAHAWAEAFIDNKWINVDTTPSQWWTEDTNNNNYFDWMTTASSYLKYRYEMFRMGKNQDINNYLISAIVLLTGFLLFRIYSRSRRKNLDNAGVSGGFDRFNDVDEIFAGVEKILSAKGMPRERHETMTGWVERLGEMSPEMLVILRFHNMRRFDPRGLSDTEKNEFIKAVEIWKKQK